jgi:hypothetical protein
MMLLILRMWQHSQGRRGLTADWMRRWSMDKPTGNPPNLREIPSCFAYLRIYARERAYSSMATETHYKKMKRMIYDTLRQLVTAGSPPIIARVYKMYPATHWSKVWRNIRDAWIDERVRSTWYEISHDLIATNVRLHKIRLADSPACRTCGDDDSLRHRLTVCRATETIWTWTRNRISWIMLMDPRWIPARWIMQPDFNLRPPKRHQATAWILGNMAFYIVHNYPHTNLQDYLHFLRRTKWKTYQMPKRQQKVGFYLEMLD